MDKIREAFEKDHGISSFVKWSFDENKYISTKDTIPEYHEHWVEVSNSRLMTFTTGFNSAMQSAQEEIERLKCTIKDFAIKDCLSCLENNCKDCDNHGIWEGIQKWTGKSYGEIMGEARP